MTRSKNTKIINSNFISFSNNFKFVEVFLRALEKMGCSFKYLNMRNECGEKVGDLEVSYHKLFGININKASISDMVTLIDVMKR